MISGQNAAALEFCYDIPRLLLLFEGLGDNCDFGVIQRAVGIEPFGLFRFTTCKPADVAALLRTRFQCLGEPDDLWLDEVGPRREYWVKSRHSSFEAHTDRYAGEDVSEVVRSALIEKTRFLKSRLVRDLSRGRRLCLWRGAADPAAIQAIAAELQTYAPTLLLWVKVADAAQVPGSVERVSAGLLHGYVSRYGDYDGGPRPPIEEWIRVCANAYRLWRGADPPQAPIENLISRAMATHTCTWFADRLVAVRVLDEPAPAGGPLFEHRLRGYSSIAQWSADPKSYAHWQRIWVTANLPADARSIFCEITAEGAVGDAFHSASWCLERGNRPLGYGYAF